MKKQYFTIERNGVIVAATNATNNYERGAIDAYNNSRYGDLSTAYKSCSYAKRRAWAHWADICERLDGRGMKVVSRNSNFFSLGFIFTDDDGRDVLAYITAYKDTFVYL